MKTMGARRAKKFELRTTHLNDECLNVFYMLKIIEMNKHCE